MDDQPNSLALIHDFATWEPVLRLLLADRPRDHGTWPVRVAGRIGRGGWSLALNRPTPPPGRAVQAEDRREETEAVDRVRNALAGTAVDSLAFTAEVEQSGRTALHLAAPSPAVEPGIGPHPGALVLVDGSVPEPWRRLPDPAPEAVPAPSADLELLERTLRERLPDAVGATEEEIAATEARLGLALPDELKALYRVTRVPWDDPDRYEEADRIGDAVGCDLSDLGDLYVADPASRHCRWGSGATEAVVTPPDAAVQGLVGSPGWIAFGDNGGGDQLAVDLTPGPRGHTGQVILLSHERDTGAELLADSLTDLVLGRPPAEPDDPRVRRQSPVVARVNRSSLESVRAAAHPALEVLSIGVWEGAPLSLAPVVGLPRLRTLTAYPGTLADPLEIKELTGLEFLALGPQEWRVLLDAGAVPPSLSAAAVVVHGDQDPLPIVALANEVLALRGRPPIVRTVLEGDLGPLA
ncbi:SMI1/KNR4 family protein [Streptomyces sp. NPDC002490]|uniref:SMI1/KNR4 family protein n=1 Tax=Streptomyces sp. NPDC002490 TaxID=3154416 RepID=UPI00331CBC8D